MFFEVKWYMHDNNWLGSQQNEFKDPLLCLLTHIMGLYSYIVLHCILLYDVNATIWPLDRSIIAEFTKGISMMTSLVNIFCLKTIKITIIVLQITQQTIDPCQLMIIGTEKLFNQYIIKDGDLLKSEKHL